MDKYRFVLSDYNAHMATIMSKTKKYQDDIKIASENIQKLEQQNNDTPSNDLALQLFVQERNLKKLQQEQQKFQDKLRTVNNMPQYKNLLEEMKFIKYSSTSPIDFSHTCNFILFTKVVACCALQILNFGSFLVSILNTWLLE